VHESYLKLAEMAITGSLTDEAGQCHGDASGKKWTGCSLQHLAPYVLEQRMAGADWPPFGHTMVGHRRLQNIRNAIEYVIAMGVDGDFAELGVWRGGSCIYAKMVLNAYNAIDRRVLLFDAFAPIRSYGSAYSYLWASLAQVRHNFQKYGVLDDSVRFYEGLFKDTLPTFRRRNHRKIAVLRVDGNFYDSHADAFYHMYRFVPIGGIIIFDDYLHAPAVQRFWNDLVHDYKLSERIVPIDKHGAWFRKLKHIDMTYNLYRKRRKGSAV